MSLLGKIAFLLTWLSLLMSWEARAEWILRVENNQFLPSYFFVVSKEQQKLYFFSNHSPLKQIFVLPCTTGQVRGDKQKEGDKKTPEGVYFIEKKLTHGLDFSLYGGVAFTLNYPNPVDILHNKSGHGIWIHGRGTPIKAFNTQGCVAVNLDHIPLIEENISFKKTPVIITKDFYWLKEKEATQLFGFILEKVQEWSWAWRKKSPDFFDFYDSNLVVEKKKDYAHFIAKKKALFKKYKWIDVFISKPKIIYGPDYIVCYFDQLFRSPALLSVGIKRLYWMQNKWDWKIVGVEWRKQKRTDVLKKYLKARTKDLKTWLDGWKTAWEKADIKAYSLFYADNAVQGKVKGLKNIINFKKNIWAKRKPKKIEIYNLQIKLSKVGFKINFVQRYEDMSGYFDLGKKEIIVEPYKDKWRILKEKWTRIDEK
ncbi:Murein L,D-transpeptidase YafK [Desulfonauticus submarinus]|uniref:Murein L,D-transpeptidase YafK n=1 Tax=Desulfonauticus submarinus TaxID=206665 RepID=A0A1H0BGX2_9BACT|nr:L,D-transpeptidase family protein [Desulfonauticus submarinus]SDN44914.1 Murein L,D-transpeptidase YafK [Desulfonauticus submarinus]